MIFALDAYPSGGWSVLAVSGDIDVHSAAELTSSIRDLLPPRATAPPRHGLVADLSEVTFIDSAGLGALVQGYKQARRHALDLRLVHPPDQLRTLLHLTGLSGVLDTFDDVAAATA